MHDKNKLLTFASSKQQNNIIHQLIQAIMKTYNSIKMMAKFLSKDEIKAAEILSITYYPMHRVPVNRYRDDLSAEFANEAECLKRCRQHLTKVRNAITEQMKLDNRYYKTNYAYDEFLSVTIAKHRKKVAHEAAMLRNRNRIMQDNSIECDCDIFSVLKTGENIGNFDYRYGKQNRVICNEFSDYKNGYARSCKFTMTRRDFTLEIKRGWHVKVVNRTITFYRTNLEEGARVEVVLQDRAIRDISTHTAYIVDGVPVLGKSYKDALTSTL